MISQLCNNTVRYKDGIVIENVWITDKKKKKKRENDVFATNVLRLLLNQIIHNGSTVLCVFILSEVSFDNNINILLVRSLESLLHIVVVIL